MDDPPPFLSRFTTNSALLITCFSVVNYTWCIYPCPHCLFLGQLSSSLTSPQCLILIISRHQVLSLHSMSLRQIWTRWSRKLPSHPLQGLTPLSGCQGILCPTFPNFSLPGQSGATKSMGGIAHPRGVATTVLAYFHYGDLGADMYSA